MTEITEFHAPDFQLQSRFKAALADAETAGGVVSIANPYGVEVFITRFIVDLTTASDGAGTVDFGVAADGETSADDLLDGLDVNAATGVFDNLVDGGTNGQAAVKWGASEYITGSAASGAAAGIVGNVYVEVARI